jgi:hypothetical protein
MFAVKSPSALQTYDSWCTEATWYKFPVVPNIFSKDGEMIKKRNVNTIIDELYEDFENEYEGTKKVRLMTNADYTTFAKIQISSNWLFEGFCMWRCVELFERYVTYDINNITMNSQQYNEQIGLVHCQSMPTGLMRLQKDLGYNNILNFEFLYFMYKLQYEKRGSATKLSIHRGEWIDYLFQVNCDTIQQLREHIKENAHNGMRFWSNEEIKKFFIFLFKYLRENENSRSLDTEVAARALDGTICRDIVNRNSRLGYFARTFCKFLYEKRNVFKCLNLDQWKIFVDFSGTIAADFSNFDVSDAWPTMYDDYVEWARSKMYTNLIKM